MYFNIALLSHDASRAPRGVALTAVRGKLRNLRRAYGVLALAFLGGYDAEAQTVGCLVAAPVNPAACTASQISCSSDSAMNAQNYGAAIGALCDSAVQLGTMGEQVTKDRDKCVTDFNVLAVKYNDNVHEYNRLSELIQEAARQNASLKKLTKALRKRCGRSCKSVKVK